MPIDKLFQNISGNPAAQGALGGAASGALAALLLHPKARKSLGSTALKLGGAAAIAGVGYYAYKKYQVSRPVPGVTADTAPAAAAMTPIKPAVPAAPIALPEAPQVSTALAMKLLKAMIAAAAADGAIDDTEMDGLLRALDAAGLSPAEKSDLTAALNRPPSVEAIAALAAGSEEAAEIYGAALEAINPDTPAEHFFLRRLARGLALDDKLVAAVHQTAGG